MERLTNYRTGPTEAQIIEDDKAYYLIPGTIVQIIKEDPANGMSQVQLGGFSTFLWTYSRFLSKHPIPDEEGNSGEELFFELALEDLRQAAHLFLRTNEATCGVDGWVSLEVSPLLAHDTRATLAKAEELYTRAGGRPQRLLFASTGTKDPRASDVLYIQALIAPLTVNTTPEGTLKAFADHGEVRGILPADGGDGEALLAKFDQASVDMKALASKLQDEGVAAFVKSWNELMKVIVSKSAALQNTGAKLPPL